MTDRERLIELLDDALAVYDVIVYALLHTDEIADHLISHGATFERHGRWEFVDDYTGKCTNCHEESIIDWEHEFPYCPECGAHMDGEVHE